MEQIEQHKKVLLEALEKCNGNVSDACAATSIGRTTFYRYLKEDPEFKATVDDIQEIAIDYVENKLFQRIQGVQAVKYSERGEYVYDIPPDTTAIIFYLKTKGKKRGYVERTELTAANGEKLFDPSSYTDEQLAAVVAAAISRSSAGS